jgi:hypothetical protein
MPRRRVGFRRRQFLSYGGQCLDRLAYRDLLLEFQQRRDRSGALPNIDEGLKHTSEVSQRGDQRLRKHDTSAQRQLTVDDS